MSSNAGEPRARELFSRIRQGDVAAFEALYREYYEQLCEFALAYVRDIDVARDVVSDTFVTLWEGRVHWNPGTSARGYLFGAVRNRAFNVLRGRHRDELRHVRYTEEFDAEGDAGDELEESGTDPVDLGMTLWEAIDRLNPRARAVMTLRWRSQLPVAEIARILETTETAVHQVHKRALAALRKLLAADVS